MQGKAGGGFGRCGQRGVGGGIALGPGGECICPSCGHREPHQRGDPCNSKICSKCGASMIRA